MLQLRMLQNVTGLSWSAVCRNCSFYRANDTWSPESLVRKHFCGRSYYRVNKLSPIARLLNNTYFRFHCNMNINNLKSHSNSDYQCKIRKQHKYYVHSYTTGVCWTKTLLSLVTCISVLAGVALVLNLVVFVTILSSRGLRKNVSMLFVCNLAISDFLISVYIVALGVYWNSASFRYLDDHDRALNCFKIGFLWMLGQSSVVSTSLLLKGSSGALKIELI